MLTALSCLTSSPSDSSASSSIKLFEDFILRERFPRTFVLVSAKLEISTKSKLTNFLLGAQVGSRWTGLDFLRMCRSDELFALDLGDIGLVLDL